MQLILKYPAYLEILLIFSLIGLILYSYDRRIVLGFDGKNIMPKLNFSRNLGNTITNNILKLPVIPAGAFTIIQDGVQDGRQNVNTPKYYDKRVPNGHLSYWTHSE